MAFVISMLIGWGVFLWIVGLILKKEPLMFAAKGVGWTIALGFLLFFLWIIKIVLLGA